MHSEFLQDSGLDAILTRATRLEYRMVSEGAISFYVVNIFSRLIASLFGILYIIVTIVRAIQ